MAVAIRLTISVSWNGFMTASNTPPPPWEICAPKPGFSTASHALEMSEMSRRFTRTPPVSVRFMVRSIASSIWAGLAPLPSATRAFP